MRACLAADTERAKTEAASTLAHWLAESNPNTAMEPHALTQTLLRFDQG